MEITSRSEAKKVGEKTYFTGKPCKHGHIAKRYVQSGTCASCIHFGVGGQISAEEVEVNANRNANITEKFNARLAAQKAGERTYFTGVPCKHGHLAKRYTQSGSCSACINGYTSPDVLERREARRVAAVDLVQVKVRCFDTDLEFIKAAAWAFGISRYPVLMLGDVYPGLLVTDHAEGQGLHKFNVHVADIEALRKIADDSIAARSNGAGEVARALIMDRLGVGECRPQVPVYGHGERTIGERALDLLALPIEKAPGFVL